MCEEPRLGRGRRARCTAMAVNGRDVFGDHAGEGVKGNSSFLKQLAKPNLKGTWWGSFTFYRADSSRGDGMIIHIRCFHS